MRRGVKETRSRTGAATLPALSSAADATVVRAGSETTAQVWHFSPAKSAWSVVSWPALEQATVGSAGWATAAMSQTWNVATTAMASAQSSRSAAASLGTLRRTTLFVTARSERQRRGSVNAVALRRRSQVSL